MFVRFPALFCIASLTSVLSGEVQVQFDGKEWVLPEGFSELSEKALKDGVCFTADANVPAAIAFRDMGLDQLLTHPVRFALRGQEGAGARLDPLPADKVSATSVIAVIRGEGNIVAACLPAGHAAGVLPNDFRSGGMSDDFEGLESFLGIVRDGVKKARTVEEVPRVVLTVRSETSFGMVVRLLQLVRSAGCHSGLVRVDDDFPGLNFDVITDPDVVPPVHKIPAGDQAGRIIVNIHADGTLMDDKNHVIDEDVVVEYVARERLRLEAEGLTPKLHIRGDSDAVFKHSRTVIRGAAEAGVDQVIFAVYKVAERKPDHFLKARETDLRMSLPKPEGKLPGDEEDARVTVDISLDAKGRVSLADEEGILDANAAERQMPLLKAKLMAIAGEKGLGEKELKIMVRVDPLTSQQRVIDLLNLLAELGISSVTFADVQAEGEK